MTRYFAASLTLVAAAVLAGCAVGPDYREPEVPLPQQFASVEGARYTRRALTIDGSSLSSGTDVVIERIEDDLAHVEAWTHVEKRL